MAKHNKELMNKRFNKLIERSKELGNTNYDFTDSVYTGSKDCITVLCSIHNKVIKIAKAEQLKENLNKCADCEKFKLKDKFKKYLKDKCINKENYDFSNSIFLGTHKPLTFRCSIHDKEITLKQACHITIGDNNKCPECSAEYREFEQRERFIILSKRKFGSKFNYSKIIDYDYQGIVTLICPEHGAFETKPPHHLNSISGCRLCGAEVPTGGYSRSEYVNNTKADKATLYVIKITGNGESFYKVGITTTTVEKRFKGVALPDEYSIEIKHIFTDLDKGLAFDAEKLIHGINRKHKYRPKLKFAGHTECFTEINNNERFYINLIRGL